MKKRILIMSASAGSGHLRAAQALETVFANDPRVDRVLNEDALQFSNTLFRDFYSKLYLSLVRTAPQVLGALYRASDEPWKTDSIRLAVDRLNTGPLVKFIRDFNPDITVCTHFMPAGIMAHLINRGVLHSHLSIVVTDFDFHAMWLTRTFHRYFVALDETKAHLEALGLPGERITVSGIPTDPAFLLAVDRRAVRMSHGLAPDRTTVLLSAGTFGVGPAEYVVNQLRQLKHDVQIIVTCGRSQELEDKVVAIIGQDARFKVFGYHPKFYELMRVADLFVGKPGGLTTAEALICGLPMVIFSPIPGQEERNSDHLLEEGIAIRANELTTIAFKVDRLLDDPNRLASMQSNALRLARPDAAQTIVHTLLEDKLTALHLDKDDREAMVLAALKA